ncbi:cadmium-translocating P-type ATPase [Shimazuella sp. AN120528]|uniref:heavy metal translocating P-type ATPase n=1 Tax=Shimazuella soli TaxID=1892854 RepID=UPI001F0D8E03|nr:heavy metal translocating P-type ATPase [Shimazuella soli]MCH5585616.1 cadmium-translocating P-type ATPase [Shimazuella soli]
MSRDEHVAVYRIEGLSCSSCAKKFEDNVNHISSVSNAKVNFGAATLTVCGIATIQDLEKAGSFDHLQLVPKHEQFEKKAWYKQRQYQQLLLSTVFLLSGFITHMIDGEHSQFGILFYILATLIGGSTLFVEGIKNLIQLRFDMTTLMTIAILGAFAIGEWSEGATVVILFAISETLERFSIDRARKSIRSLVDLSPKEAWIRKDGEEKCVPIYDVEVGDICIIKAGQKIAMDGRVIKGVSSVNQSAITGESIPVVKQLGDEVFAGTLNEDGYLEVEVSKKATDTTLSKIIQLVEEAQANRAPSQAFIDQFAKYYTPAILILAILLAVVPPFFQGNWLTWIYRGLTVLVVGCPCALVISTPVAIVTSIGNAARNGVLIKGGVYLEELSAIQTVAFDKTGTLTQGKPEVTDFLSFTDKNERSLLEIAMTLESGSTHPLAAAITRYANERLIIPQENVESFQSHTGKGVEGILYGIRHFLGSPSWFENKLTPEVTSKITSYQQKGKTVVLLGTEKEILGGFAIADQPREKSKQVIQELNRVGVEHIVMLTGDNEQTAKGIAHHLGIKEVKSDLMPEGKQHYLKSLRDTGISVAMVGDGVNDAPALAVSHVGIAMGGAGSDTALETADMVLMADDLEKLPFAIRLSRFTKRIIGQNITVALGLKLLALLLIIPGMLTLWLAVFADMGATVLVTFNALRLLRSK